MGAAEKYMKAFEALETGVSIASSYSGQFGEELEFEQGPCQDGYVQIGVKDKDGRVVPNCVPEESANK